MINLLNYPTGYGKTKESIKFLKKLFKPKKIINVCVIVQSQKMVKQWTKELNSMRIRKQLHIDIYSINSVKFNLSYVCCIIDEPHRYKSKKQSATIDLIMNHCDETLLLTATPNKRILNYPNLVTHVVTRKEAIQKKRMAKSTIHSHPNNLTQIEQERYAVATAYIEKVKSLYDNFIKLKQYVAFKRESIYKFIEDYMYYPELKIVKGDEPLDSKVWNYIAAANGLNGKQYNGIRERFVNYLKLTNMRKSIVDQAENKLTKTVEVINNCEGRVIVFCGNIKAANYVAANVRLDKKLAVITSKRNDYNYSSKKLDDADIIINVRKLNTGINDVLLRNVVITSYNWDPETAIQQVGRGLRYSKNKVTNIHLLYVSETIEETKYINTLNSINN